MADVKSTITCYCEMKTGAAGEQLDGQTLYERQKRFRHVSDDSPAPIIVARIVREVL